MALHAAIDIIDAVGGVDTELIAAVTNRRIKVLSLCFQADANVTTIQLESGTAGNFLTGLMPVGASAKITLNYNSVGWMITQPGENLNINMITANSAIDGVIVYEVMAA